MNKEELIGKLQMVYAGDINVLNELIGYYDGLKQGIEELQQENKELKIQISAREEVCNRLEDNWNKLKEWASNFYNSEEVGWAGCGMRYTLEKMKEIERSEINDKK